MHSKDLVRASDIAETVHKLEDIHDLSMEWDSHFMSVNGLVCMQSATDEKAFLSWVEAQRRLNQEDESNESNESS